MKQDKIIQTALQNNEKMASLALRRAINKVATQANNYLIRESAGMLALQRNKIREPFTLKRASKDHLNAEIKVRRIAVPLIEYRPRQLKRGHSIRVKKDRGRQKLERTFEAMLKGKIQLMQREEEKRGYPIRRLYGPAVIEVTQDYLDTATQRAQDKLLAVFRHEYAFAMGEL